MKIAPDREIVRAARWVAERAPTPFLVTEGDAHVVRYANPAFLALLSEDAAGSLIGQPFPEAFPEPGSGASRGHLDEAYRAGGAMKTPEFEHTGPDGGVRVLCFTIWPMGAEGRGTAYLVVTGHDSTRQAGELRRGQQLAEETRQVNERLVVASVRMHELADEAEVARQRLEILAEAGSLLDASFDTSTVLPALTRLLVPGLGDVCAVELWGERGSVARRVTEPATIDEGAGELVALAGRRAVEERRPLVCRAPGGGESDELEQRLQALGFTSLVAIPLHKTSRAHGVMILLSRRSRLDPADVTLAGQIADRTALALDRVDVYQAAVTAARERQDLLATVAHDLRNLLHTILLSVALVEKGEGARGPSKGRHVERIRSTAEYMEHLVGDLTESAKIEAHQLLVEPQPLALAPFVNELVELMMPLAASKSIQLETVLVDGVASRVVWIDRWRMTQVLTNLIGNAIKFTPDGGVIVVRADIHDNELILSVRDTGPGIKGDDVEHLFDRFWQARRTAHFGLGTGLGLFIAKGIVDAHGGRIWVESEVGVGSTFFVAIPVLPDEARSEEPAAER